MESTGKRLAGIADSNPEAVIGFLAREHRQGHLDEAALLELAQVFRHAGVNLIALLVENPEATEELLGIEAAALEPHVDSFAVE